ncbi:hypothetical protein E2562_026345 [Oryza meyeriana var. granulata]|uniref:Uncharacterized protein n=1 Tax=Oryza meyeriana var. granulata TaxID=110450 RepID=A0A6G1D765_9ORYZ|nr:hypothetical protein E2562_026345 [Oryza meyeriana var. granulata]
MVDIISNPLHVSRTSARRVSRTSMINTSIIVQPLTLILNIILTLFRWWTPILSSMCLTCWQKMIH